MRGPTGRWAWATPMLLAVSTMAAADEATAKRPDLLVLWSDPEGSVPDAVRRDLVRETAALFRLWGVTLLTSSEGRGARPLPQVRVVLLDRAQLGNSGSRVLGQTNTTPQEFPAVWILVPNVRQLLAGTVGDASAGILARALARVVAHEIVHVLAPGLGHASSGLMRPRLGAVDLLRPWVQVSDTFRQALLEAVRQTPTPQATQERL